MIASVQYIVLGSETKIPVNPASGLTIIDVIVNGVSQDFSGVSEQYGTVDVAGLVRGDYVKVLYKTLPRLETSVLDDFEIIDVDVDDFA